MLTLREKWTVRIYWAHLGSPSHIQGHIRGFPYNSLHAQVHYPNKFNRILKSVCVLNINVYALSTRTCCYMFNRHPRCRHSDRIWKMSTEKPHTSFNAKTIFRYSTKLFYLIRQVRLLVKAHPTLKSELIMTPDVLMVKQGPRRGPRLE